MLTKLISAFFLIASGAIGIVFYVQPLWQKFHEIRRETDYLQSVSAELDSLIANRDLLLKKINAISREDLSRINAAIPKGQQAAEFLTFAEALVNRHGLALTNLNLTGTIGAGPKPGDSPRPSVVRRVQNPAGVEELPVNMEMAGSYAAFKAFLRDLETEARITDVESLTFTPQDESSKMRLQIKTYYQ